MLMNNVIIIGSGISGLICALKFCNEKYKVKIITKSPDILSNSKEFYSSTMNGESGRFFTVFEGHPYIGNSETYPNMRDAFRERISKGGWLGKDLEYYTKDERKWLEKRWKFNENDLTYQENFEYYVDANKWSISWWKDFTENHPELFDNTSYYDKKVLRLYNGRPQLKFAIDLHRKYGALKSVLSRDDVGNDYPIFKEACNTGFFRGGIEVIGQSINIKQFAANLTKFLLSKGVEFILDTEIQSIDFDKKKSITSISSAEKTYKAENYVFCTGAYHNKDLFANTVTFNKFGGVAGIWFIIPKPRDFNVPTKIHIQMPKASGKSFPVVDFNFTPYYDVADKQYKVAIGGGYLYSGNSPFRDISQELNFVQEINKRALEKTLGSDYQHLLENGDLIFSNAICQRSFSFNDIPVFDTISTSSGGKLVITGGTNTGTATMSPFIADKVYQIISS